MSTVSIEGSNPYLGEYDAFAATAKTAYQQALAKIATQRTGFQTGYGLGPDGKPLANQPYGQYQQMLGSMAGDAEAQDAMGRARGLGGGISRQAQEAVSRRNRQTTYDFGQNYQAGLTSFADAETGATQGYNNSLMEKMTEITQRAIQDRMFMPADYSGIGPEPYGDTSPMPGSPGLPFRPPTRSIGRPKKRRPRRRRR